MISFCLYSHSNIAEIPFLTPQRQWLGVGLNFLPFAILRIWGVNTHLISFVILEFCVKDGIPLLECVARYGIAVRRKIHSHLALVAINVL